MAQTISRIASSSSTTRMRSGICVSGYYRRFYARADVPKVTSVVRKRIAYAAERDIQRQGLFRLGARSQSKMNSLWSICHTAQPALAGLKAGEWALVIMLGASLLVLS